MNLGKLLSNFAKHYKPGHGGFSLNKPVNSNGVTEQSFAGVQVPMQNQAGSQMIKNADPQTAYRGRMNAVEGNPLNFVGDLGTKLLGGQNGRVELSGGTEPVPLDSTGSPMAMKPVITEEMLRQDRERRAASRQDKVFDARTGEELSPERRGQILKDVAIKAAKTGQSGDYATDGTFLGDSSGSSGSEVDGGTDWDTWSREVDAGLRTPPFVSSPGWEAARRRQYLPPMATRPRIVPQQPVNAIATPDAATLPPQGQGSDGAYPTEMSPAETAKPMSGMGAALAKTKSEINRREGKDFSKKVNPETGEITYGADYDKDHDWKDSLRSAGLGILQSLAQADPRESLGTMLGRGLGGGISGGVAGALDRNADEKLGNKIALGNLYQDYAKQLGVQDAELGIAKKKKDIENIDVDNDRLKQKAEDDVELRTVEQQIRRDRLTFDKEKAAELAQLRRDQLEYRKEGDTKRYAQTQARIDELTRHNKVMEGQGERKTQAIESRAKMAADKAKTSIPAQSKRKGVLTDAQIIKIATGIDDDFNNGRIDEATYNARINLMLEGINGRNK